MDTKATDWYKKLPPSEKLIIQALCFANVEVSASTLALWISKASVRTTSGTAYKQTDISAVLGEGLKQKILTSPKKSYCLVANEFRDMIIEDIRVNKMPFEDLHLVFSEHFLCITINQYLLS